MRIYGYAAFMAVLGLSGCTWVEPTKEGAEVRVVEASEIETCRNLGTTNAFVKHKVGIIARSEEKVSEELVTLAKNSAAEKGGDSIVAKGPASEGSMSFDIYKCGE